MKRQAAGCLIALVLSGSLTGLAQAQDAASPESLQALYRVDNLPSLGGSYSVGASINDRIWVAGPSNLEGDAVRHATLWRNSVPTDLGTLGGPQTNSSVVWPVENVRGVISGIAETDALNPLGEDWSCATFFPSATGHICLGFVWRDGRMQALPTLGGYNGFATGTNNRLQTVGWAENAVHDATCEAPQVLQFRAAIWGPRAGQVRELAPLTTDTVSAATAINDRGQVVGISGICDRAVGRFSARHAVLWNPDGTATDIGNLGGVAWNTPMAINQRGDVVGFSNVSADDGGVFAAHGFLWTAADGITPLDPLPGDVYSQALGINEQRQVVGLSCAAGFASCRAFLWERGVMQDLNAIAPGYADHLYAANDINDRGQITGEAVEQATGDSVAFVANRLSGGSCGPDQEAASMCAVSSIPGATTSGILPESVRQALMARLGIDDRQLGQCPSGQ